MKRLPHVLMMSFILLLASCSNDAVHEGIAIEVNFSEEMLFEGSNTLQMKALSTPEALATAAGTTPDKLKQVVISKAVLRMAPEAASTTESLLLQMVSDNQGIKTMGTLSPLTDAATLQLSLSEKPDVLPFLKDAGATWVLDLNLSADRDDELNVLGTITLNVIYKN